VDFKQRVNDRFLRLLPDLDFREISAILRTGELVSPEVDRGAVVGLKFSAALPDYLARRTVAERLMDIDGASTVIDELRRFLNLNQ
jgi:ATP-dependent Lhr-like helicase